MRILPPTVEARAAAGAYTAGVQLCRVCGGPSHARRLPCMWALYALHLLFQIPAAASLVVATTYYMIVHVVPVPVHRWTHYSVEGSDVRLPVPRTCVAGYCTVLYCSTTAVVLHASS